MLRVEEVTEHSEAQMLSQYFTKQGVVEKILQIVELEDYDLIIEPSAGDGAFSKHLPKEKTVAVDLEPKAKGIKEKDFLEFSDSISMVLPLIAEDKRVLTIGNPPFGKNSSLARRFFNLSAEYSDVIAFVLPRTFRKPSVINYLNRKFHLTYEEILPLDSFYTPEEESYNVPTVFQIWKKESEDREDIPIHRMCEDFEFVSKENLTYVPLQVWPPNPVFGEVSYLVGCDFSIQRVGGNAGKVYDGGCKRHWRYHHFIKVKNDKIDVKAIFESIDWEVPDGPKFDTAGNPSISKNDFIRYYLEYKKKETIE
jgi:predicted RNA methylase